MHERARCLWRGNLLRTENRSSSSAQLSPPSALAEAGWERKRRGRKGWGRKTRPRTTEGRAGRGGRGEAPVRSGEWVWGAEEACQKGGGKRPGSGWRRCCTVSMATPAAAGRACWPPPLGYPARGGGRIRQVALAPCVTSRCHPVLGTSAAAPWGDGVHGAALQASG